MQVVRSRKVRSGVYWDTSGLWSGSSARHGKWSVAAPDGGSTQVAHAHAARAQHASSEAPQALRCRTGQRIHTDGPQLHHPADPHRRHHVAGHASRGCQQATHLNLELLRRLALRRGPPGGRLVAHLHHAPQGRPPLDRKGPTDQARPTPCPMASVRPDGAALSLGSPLEFRTEK